MISPHSFHRLVQEGMAQVDQVIRTCLSTDAVLVRQGTEFMIAAGQERIRPVVTLLAAGALGYDGEQQYRLAAAVELIQGSLDLHNQVNDPDSVGGDLGNAAEILLGDLLYTGAFKLIVGLEDMPVMRVLSDATNVIAEAEVRQRELGASLAYASPEYLRLGYPEVFQCSCHHINHSVTGKSNTNTGFCNMIIKFQFSFYVNSCGITFAALIVKLYLFKF